MTRNEVNAVAKIMMTADGGCGVCASALLRKLYDELRDTHDVEMLSEELNCAWVNAGFIFDGWMEQK